MLLIMHGYFLKMSKTYNLNMKNISAESLGEVFYLELLGKEKRKRCVKKRRSKTINWLDYVNKKYGTNFVYIKDSDKSTDDIADSIGVALCAICEEE